MHASLLGTMPSITAWGFSSNRSFWQGNWVSKLPALMAVSTTYIPSLLHMLLTTPNSAWLPAVWRIDAPPVWFQQMSVETLCFHSVIEIPNSLFRLWNDTAMGNSPTYSQMTVFGPVTIPSGPIFHTPIYSHVLLLMHCTSFTRVYSTITLCPGLRALLTKRALMPASRLFPAFRVFIISKMAYRAFLSGLERRSRRCNEFNWALSQDWLTITSLLLLRLYWTSFTMPSTLRIPHKPWTAWKLLSRPFTLIRMLSSTPKFMNTSTFLNYTTFFTISNLFALLAAQTATIPNTWSGFILIMQKMPIATSVTLTTSLKWLCGCNVKRQFTITRHKSVGSGTHSMPSLTMLKTSKALFQVRMLR